MPIVLLCTDNVLHAQGCRAEKLPPAHGAQSECIHLVLILLLQLAPRNGEDTSSENRIRDVAAMLGNVRGQPGRKPALLCRGARLEDL